MNNYQDGDIVLSRESTFTSWVIRKMTSSDWSHAGIIIDDKLVSAVPMTGVCIRSLDVAKTRVVYRYKGDLTDSHKANIKLFAADNIGKPYDMTQVFLLGWRILRGTIETSTGDPNPTAFECLEFVSEAYYKAGIQLSKCVDNLLPNMIVNSSVFSRVID